VNKPVVTDSLAVAVQSSFIFKKCHSSVLEIGDVAEM
jgi:hypothetical protein